MKKLTNCALTVAGLLLLMGCAATPSAVSSPLTSPAATPRAAIDSPLSVPPTSVGAPFTLNLGQTASFDGGLALTFASVPEDSRCPQNARCVQAGQARVMLHAVAPGKASADLELTLGANEADAFANHEGYTVRLLALDPFPSVGDNATKAPYRATFIVTLA